MTQYKHIVQLHPVENGEPNLSKILLEKEFDTKWDAMRCVGYFNGYLGKDPESDVAVYHGCVNLESGSQNE